MKQKPQNKWRNVTRITIYHQEKETKFFCGLWHLPFLNDHPKEGKRKFLRKPLYELKKEAWRKLLIEENLA